MNKTTSLGTVVITNPKTNGSVRQSNYDGWTEPLMQTEQRKARILVNCVRPLTDEDIEKVRELINECDTDPAHKATAHDAAVTQGWLEFESWQDTPEYKEAHEVANKFDFAAIEPIKF